MLAILLACTLLGGCGDSASPSTSTAPPPAANRAAAAAPDAAPDDERPTVVFLGDSLTAGYGLDEAQAFPALVGAALAADGTPVRVVNAGVTGDTTAGGLARLDWLLRQSPDVLVVGLGGNDGLRGLDPVASEANLRAIIERAREADVVVVLLGMRMPPNYGPDYTEQFAGIYRSLADTFDVVDVPFVLEGVGGERDLNLPDGIHPNVEGHRIIARTVVTAVRAALERARGEEEG